MTQKEFQDRYIKARRRLIEAEFSHLNPFQREAVMATEGPLLLLAGAGSGKTTVLINRIANILRFGRASDSADLPEGADENGLAVLENPESDMEKAVRLAALEPAQPWRVLAITFTNKAADELKERLSTRLGPDANDVWAMTFHSACVRILRRDAHKLGFESGFSIYDSSDSESLMKRIIKERDLDDKLFPHKAVLGHISRAKDALLSPEEVLKTARESGDGRKIKLAELYGEYAARLRRSNAMDFDDLIYFTVRLLLGDDEVRDYYRRKFQYVLVDEYQDTNNLQYLLAATLAGGHGNICVVGDDDQSIYRFRGATIENILSFEKQYKNARTIRLEQNYRSTGHILDAANAVIKNNEGRKGKNLWTEKDAGDKPELFIAQNESDEARYVADRIMLSRSKGGAWRENAVLYRMNAQSNQLEYAFKRNAIPYRVVGGTRFFDRMEIKDILAYLCVALSPEDETRLARIINTPHRGIGPATVDKARELAAKNRIPLFEVVSDAEKYPELERSAKRLRAFAAMLDELRELAGVMPLDEFYDTVLDRTGYIRALEEKLTDENIARIENVRELKSNILTFIKETGDSSLAGFLDEVALYTDLDGLDRDADSVVMMTMHSAKGLEFKNVFIVGAEEGIFPSYRCIGEPQEMEEERRLCYVAITRARKNLYICCARQRMLFGKTTSNSVSRFVDEIPREHISRPDAEVSRPPSQRRPEPRLRQARPVEMARQTPPASYKAGDDVAHSVFGKGMISKMTAMGGDYLVEIDFEDAGKKRLMLRAAAQYMTKQ